MSSTDLYGQAEWQFAERWSAHGGVRTAGCSSSHGDFFITPGNPDDSGERTLFRHARRWPGCCTGSGKNISVYGNLGRGFETPTLRGAGAPEPGSGSGLNFDLKAARSRHAELGAKAVLAASRGSTPRCSTSARGTRSWSTLAAGGRTTFKNAGARAQGRRARRRDAASKGPFSSSSPTRGCDAAFRDGFTRGGAAVPAGNLIPGVPRTPGLRPGALPQEPFYGGLEALRRSRVAVDDAERRIRATRSRVVNLVAGLMRQGRRLALTGFVRIDNLTDRSYAAR